MQVVLLYEIVTCAIESDAIANKNISVVNVTTANEPVFSSSAEIQHL